VYTLKQITEYYNQRSSPVYICYLDASKAFDRINQLCLFKKLIKRIIDVTLIRLLIFWHCQQTFCVRWANQFFTVSNCVRHGRIMSPVFVNIFIDELSSNLNQSYIGCSMNGMIINNLMHVDDT